LCHFHYHSFIKELSSASFFTELFLVLAQDPHELPFFSLGLFPPFPKHPPPFNSKKPPLVQNFFLNSSNGFETIAFHVPPPVSAAHGGF